MSQTPYPLRYHVQTATSEIGVVFPSFPHHDSVSALWREKWRRPCSLGIYPFTDGRLEDFDPIFAELIEISGDDPSILNRPDEYAGPFLSAGRALVADAEDAAAGGNIDTAKQLFLRAAAVFRMGRFPLNRSAATQQAWAEGKSAYEQGSQYLDPPNRAVQIPFRHADADAGDQDEPIPAYLRIPSGPVPAGGWPVLLFICGLDAYRSDHTPRTQAHNDHGVATLSFEIPGTGDCPAAPGDPTSPDRLMSSVLDWVQESGGALGLDPSRIVARGISTGGYYAFRVAHTHADRLVAVVAQGGGAHAMFDPRWIAAQNQMEYPFALADALAYKFGYRAPDKSAALRAYTAGAHRFSLDQDGTLTTPTTKLLVINGMEDSIFPIEDTLLVATAGVNVDLTVLGNRGHMGNPGAEDLIYAWLDAALAENAPGHL
jgi:pimeloyl-ACP methyl ester carboxylesterase